MKDFTIRTLAMLLTQPIAMYLLLRVLEFDFFAAAGLATLVAMLVGFSIYWLQSREKNRRHDP